MKRWLILSCGLAALALAAWALLTTPRTGTDEIGDASRAELERVLRDAGERSP